MTDSIAKEVEKIAEDLGVDRKRSIGEVAKELRIKTHVIRFWEENFPQIKPEIGTGSRRYYYNKQLKVLRRIKKFLYDEGYTIAGLQKLLNRRKQDDDKEEDLEILTNETPALRNCLLSRCDEPDMLYSQEPQIVSRVIKAGSLNTGSRQTHDETDASQSNKEIGLDDFIDPNIKPETGEKISADTRLMDFANIKIATIDPKIKKEIEHHLLSAKKNLAKLKSIFLS